MEHIVQFGISIDDDAIKKSIEASAEKAIIGKIKDDIMYKLINRWGNLTNLSETVIKRIIDEHKDEIIEKASTSVADSMKRSKKYREALSKIVEDIEQ